MGSPSNHHRLLLHHHGGLMLSVSLLWTLSCVHAARASQFSDLKSKISGVEELLEEFTKQLQQEQEEGAAAAAAAAGGDACLGGFSAIQGHIIRTRDSIDMGATFLTAPTRVHSRGACLRACCAEPRCSVAVVQEEEEEEEEEGGAEEREVTLGCFLFDCVRGGRGVCAFSSQRGYSSYSRAAARGGGASPTPARADSTERRVQDATAAEHSGAQGVDEPPRGDAGPDVVIQLPTDWAVLDGRDSMDDHGIVRYEWTLVQGDPSVNTKVTQPGILKITGLQEGTYHFRMIVTDTAGQRSSDNVTITVLPPEHQPKACTGHCSRYQFTCDDGCCVDITYACDGKQQCPDRSDEEFCQKFDGSRKVVTHPSGSVTHRQDFDDGVMLLGGTRTAMEEPDKASGAHSRGKLLPPPYSPRDNKQGPEVCLAPHDAGPCNGVFSRWYYDQLTGVCKRFIFGGCKGNGNNFLREEDCANRCIPKPDAGKQKNFTGPQPSKPTETPLLSVAKLMPGAVHKDKDESSTVVGKVDPVRGGHPVPESGLEPIISSRWRNLRCAVHVSASAIDLLTYECVRQRVHFCSVPPPVGAILPLALGLIITALLLLMVGCRLRLVRRKLKKARPITSEESDYLINGMYL
ncbi:low-density lipoprotein receptor-related protein 11 isoform X2 [Scleropages formosus]|uniref:low-density lipoprotein receptor-related protein 11 isoform X2 n=1 Tax=Scleropages formosus TaxID=113540 RepID=UPI0010FA9B40|nr:low-density lipoprotein receptor-related protein 11 isoform X2 [Scleropages formosus]